MVRAIAAHATQAAAGAAIRDTPAGAAVQATGVGGVPLTAAQLGFQGAFNYCTPTTPRPASCSGMAQSDVPTWNPATSTLTGSGTDTAGASGWFRPTVTVTSITFTYSVITGSPSFQLWSSVLVWDISGNVSLDTGGAPPAGTTVQLIDANGAFVDSIAFSGSDPGNYGFGDVAAAPYTMRVLPPEGYEVVGASSRPADATNGDVTGVDFVLRQIPPTTTTTITTTTTTTTSSTTTTSTTIPSTTSTSTSTSTTDPGSTTTSTTNPGSTTSTSSTTSTTIAKATTTTRGGGRLPATGNSGSNSIIAIAAILGAAGLAFYLVARRSHWRQGLRLRAR